MSRRESEHTLAFLLDFHGRIHVMEQGYFLKFEIWKVDPTPQRPHGLRYSFTLHDQYSHRILGFDNAHGVAEPGARFKGRSNAHDHWHRGPKDKGVPYAFKDAETLIDDFFNAVEAAPIGRASCRERVCQYV